MASHRRHGTPRRTHADPAGRARSGANRWTRQPRDTGRPANPALRTHADDVPDALFTTPQLEHLWDRHGRSVYALACALLGDETAAARAVTLGMTDLAGSTEIVSADDARLVWARHVYWRCQELAIDSSTTSQLPRVMVWLGQLAQLQRACLALCLFGGHTRQEAADLVGVPPAAVADLLTAGLREVARLAAGGTASTR